MIKSNYLDQIEYMYKGKQIKIPYFHTPGFDGCGCITCKLIKGQINLDMYLGYRLGLYISNLESHCVNNVNEEILQQVFDPAEIYEFVMES